MSSSIFVVFLLAAAAAESAPSVQRNAGTEGTRPPSGAGPAPAAAGQAAPAPPPAAAPPTARPAQQAPAPPAAPKEDPMAFKIGPEDLLNISVWQNAELSRAVPVRPDGMISLPLIRDVQAEGLTPSKLAAELEERLKEYMPAGQVSVIVTEVHSFKVSVIGKVQRPDRYRLRSPTTVLDALAMAGGLQEYADGDKIVVLRPQTFVSGRYQTGKTFRRIPFNYKKVITVGGETENFALQPDDIIVVP